MGADAPLGASDNREIGEINKCLKTNTYDINANAAPATVSERGGLCDVLQRHRDDAPTSHCERA
jgi:hypothetical protein